MKRNHAEVVGLAIGLLLGLSPVAFALLTHAPLDLVSGLGLMLAAFCALQLLRGT